MHSESYAEIPAAPALQQKKVPEYANTGSRRVTWTTHDHTGSEMYTRDTPDSLFFQLKEGPPLTHLTIVAECLDESRRRDV